jgi:hypothetical protein
MFDLEKSIAEWRRQMIAGGIKSSVVLDELESHLREDIEQRMRSGARAQQAFEEAAQHIGNADALKLEFAKVTPPGPLLSFDFQRAACFALALFIVLAETWTLFEYEMTSAVRIFGLAVAWASAAYIGLFPYLNRNCWHNLRGLEIRKALVFVCSCVVPLWVLYLLLSTTNLVHLPSAIIYGVVFWSVVNVCWVTGLGLFYGFDAESLNLWTPGVQEAFEVAQTEAVRFHHDFIGTEHVLLGLLGVENSCVSKVLGKMGVRPETVRAEIEKIVGCFPQSHPVQAQPYTPRAKKALAIAMREAKAMRRDRVDSEHVFLGLICEGTGVAAIVLKKLGVDVWDARKEILRMRSV